MTSYLLSMIQPTGPIPGPEVLGPVMQKLDAIREELQSKGQWVFGNGLTQPSSATLLTPKGDEVLVTDGPFAESKEYLGGITIIEAVDLDEALGVAEQFASITGLKMEVRAFR
ncbi:MAG: YciI family protein [Actinomycetota bacterium]